MCSIEISIASAPARSSTRKIVPLGPRPHEVADEPSAVRQLVDELFSGALHGYLTPGAMTSAYLPGKPGTSMVSKGPPSPER